MVQASKICGVASNALSSVAISSRGAARCINGSDRNILVICAFAACLGAQTIAAQTLEQRPVRSHSDKNISRFPDSPKAYQKWLDEDVAYIITKQERAEFQKLTTAEQCDKFVEAFWGRRNPNPGSPENTFKEEHYRRLAYTNQHFAADVPGWKTDRGRIYIMYGPPDQIDRHFSAAGSNKASDLVGVGSIPYDWELWHYRSIEGVGKDVNFRFVDTCNCGRYQMPVTKEDLNNTNPNSSADSADACRPHL